MATEKINGVWHVSNKTSGGGGGGGTDPNAVHFTQQSLTTEQQAQARTNIGAGTYSKPSGGIPSSDMASAVQTSLGKADTAYQKPSTGIPASDLATGVIPAAVEANPTVPSGTTPTNLTGLKVGSGYYSVPQGGGGSDTNAQKTYDSYPSSGELKEGDIYAGTAFIETSGNLLDTQEVGYDEFIRVQYWGYSSCSAAIYDGSTLILTVNASADGNAGETYVNLYDANGDLVASSINDPCYYEYMPMDGITAVTTSGTTEDFLWIDSGYNESVNYEVFNGSGYIRKPIPNISNDAARDRDLSDAVASPGSVYNEVHPAVQSSQPAGGILPNVLYKLGTLTGSVTIAFATPADNTVENEYKFTFTAGSTAPTITWPASITKWAGNALDSGLPNVEADTYYEVSVEDGMGIINKFE